MREFAKVSPQIWINECGRNIKKLGHQAQLVSLYLLTNPHANMIGVYYLPISFIAHEIGITSNQAEAAIQSLCQIKYCSYDFESEYVWVHDMGLTQISSKLKIKDHRVKNVNELFHALPDLPFKNNFFTKYADIFLLEKNKDLQSPFEETLKSLASKEKEKENENENNNENTNILSGEPDIACETTLLSEEKEAGEGKIKQSASYLSHATEILNFLNEKTKCRFRLEDTNLKLIIARLKSGATVEDCRAVIARKFRDWHGTDMQKYLRPATLFNAIKFEQYLGECVVVEEVIDEINKKGRKDECE